jgi:hypothetical protein
MRNSDLSAFPKLALPFGWILLVLAMGGTDSSSLNNNRVCFQGNVVMIILIGGSTYNAFTSTSPLPTRQELLSNSLASPPLD